MFPTAYAPRVIPLDAKQHPEWPKFLAHMKGKNVPEPKILLIWTLTLKGIKLQKEMNDTGRRYEANAHFAEVAEAMKAELSLLPTDRLALWSGGFAVSDYARKRKGCETLESTALGGAFDALELYSDWKCIGPLWNAISRKFVEQGRGFVEVYVRVHAPDSVLYRQEVPMLEANMANGGLPPELKMRGLFWHALFGDGDWHLLREINPKGELVASHGFPSEREARMAMKNFLVRRSQRGEKATFATGAMKID